FRFLATLSHLTFHLSARLPLYSARRQPGGMDAGRDQPCHCYVPGRSLAWRCLDVCRLGITPWLLSGDRTCIASSRRRTSMDREFCGETSTRFCYLRRSLPGMGLFPSLRF